MNPTSGEKTGIDDARMNDVIVHPATQESQ